MLIENIWKKIGGTRKEGEGEGANGERLGKAEWIRKLFNRSMAFCIY